MHDPHPHPRRGRHRPRAIRDGEPPRVDRAPPPRHHRLNPMSHGREREGLLLLLLSAAGFGAMAVLAKLAYAAGASVPEVLTVRFALAAVVLGTLARRRPARAPLTRRSVLTGLGLGAGLYAAESGLFYASLTRLHADVAELLLYAYPGLVVAGAVALKRESFSARRGAALGVAGAGVGLVLLGGQAVA